ncbi:MAG TPA: cation:dicarboxylase symporter family transporter [Rectinemataceae bacterium]|nr:cation:dicarboxylase symporter family transporter [Rectinemataceae bacterium]
MKLWFKYAAGILFGAALFAVCPKTLLDDGGALASVAELSIRIGYYVFGALLCVNIPLSVLKLYEEKKFWSIGLKSLRFFLLSLFAATAIGIAAALVALPVRIPLLSDTSSQSVQSIGSGLFEIFPESLGAIFLGPGGRIVPAIVFAFIIGLAMAHDPIAARPAANLLDSLSRIFHTINAFMTEILGVLLIPISARALYLVTTSLGGGIYASFLLILGIASSALLLLFIPLAIFLLSGRKNPIPVLYSGLPAALAALISGNLRFSAGLTMRQARENLGIKRRYNAIAMPAGLLFGRAGTAFVAAISFVIILSSYSQLAISIPSLIAIFLLIPATTILASSSMQSGPIAVLTLSCGFFGRGFENGYLVMVPIAMLLSMIASLIDALWIGASQALVARHIIARDQKDSRHFI